MHPIAITNRTGAEDSTPEPGNGTEQNSDSRFATTLTYEERVYRLLVSINRSRGSGAFGVVFTADMVGPPDKLGSSIKETVAIKIFRSVVPETQRKLISREVESWKQLKHHRILPFYGMCKFGVQQVGLVSQLAPHGNMNEYIARNPTKNRLRLLQQVAEGLVYLHLTAKLVHGDLKGTNVLISADESALLADFGLSTFILARETATTTNIRMLNSAPFAAPELFSDNAYQDAGAQQPRSKTTYSDSFAFAGLIYEAYSGEAPWRGARPETIIYKVVIKHETPPRTVENQLALSMSDDVWKLCTRCWSRDPTGRPDCTEILKTLTSEWECSSSDPGLAVQAGNRPVEGSLGPLHSCRQFLSRFIW